MGSCEQINCWRLKVGMCIAGVRTPLDCRERVSQLPVGQLAVLVVAQGAANNNMATWSNDENEWWKCGVRSQICWVEFARNCDTLLPPAHEDHLLYMG